MNKNKKIIFSITLIIGGWFLCGLGYTTIVGHPISTICLLLGIGSFFAGLILLIIILQKK